MKVVRCAFVGLLVVSMLGCGALLGYHEEKGDDGKPKIVVDGPGLVGTVGGLIGSLGPWGIAAGAALGLATKVIRHREIIARGQKDDDFDGVPDDQQQKPPTVPPAAAA